MSLTDGMKTFKAVKQVKYLARLVITEEVTYQPNQNGYGDHKSELQPKDSNRSVIDVTLVGDDLDALKLVLPKYVELAN